MNKIDIVCFGNCQAMQIARYLDAYLDKNVYNIYLLSNYDETFSSHETVRAVSNADYIIYQPLNHTYEDLSEANIRQLAKEDAKFVAFPYIYNGGLYSLETDATKIIGEDTILELFNSGVSKENIMAMRERGEINFNLKEKFNESLNVMRQREEKTDVKLSDFIQNNYLEVQLFLSHNHPTNILFDEVIRQINDILDLGIELSSNTFIPPLCETVAPITRFDRLEHGYKWYPYRFHSSHASNVIIELIIYRYVINLLKEQKVIEGI